MILKLLLSYSMIWIIFIKILKNAIWKNPKTLIIFDDINPHVISNEKRNPIVTELFIRVRKLNISLIFIAQSYFAVPKNITLTPTLYFILKINENFSKLHLIIHQIWNLYKKCTWNPCCFSVIVATHGLR